MTRRDFSKVLIGTALAGAALPITAQQGSKMKAIVTLGKSDAIDDTQFNQAFEASVFIAPGDIRNFSASSSIGISASAAQMKTAIENAVVGHAAGQSPPIIITTQNILIPQLL